MKILVGDLRLFVDVEGSSLRVDGPQMRQAPTLLLLHGGPFIDHSMFKPEHSQLCDAAQLVYLDHRGRGRSERGDRAKWNLEQWGNDVHAFCDALEIEMMGVSFGGIVAMSYATRHPEHAAGLILCSTMARWRDERSLCAFEKLGGPEAREAARRLWDEPTRENSRAYSSKCGPLCLQLTQGKPRLSSTQVSELMSRFTRSVTNWEVNEFFLRGEKRKFDFLPQLNRIRCPTLIMSGTVDPIATLADSMDIARALPAQLCQMEVIDGAGHGIIDDAPEPYFEAIRKFIICAQPYWHH